MKRIVTILLSAILLCAALPHAMTAADTDMCADADHVLIYNPLPYAKNANMLYTGTITKEETEEPSGQAPYTSGMHRTGEDLATRSDTEDTHAFWICTDLNTYQYNRYTFRLAAESEHCTIWTLPNDSVSFTEEQAQRMAEQFETVIWPTETASFGPFRDLGGDGKLRIVTYAMNSLSVCGFFDSYDLYTAEEIAKIDPDDAESYNCLPIINVNARMSGSETTVLCTLAHEFQHLILRSAVLASPANADRLGTETTVGLWLNEGFSMAAEELCYPGAVAQQGYLSAFGRSDKVQYGMSYQNFDAASTDVGAYAQSFLFAQYLKTQCGDEAFASFLNRWRAATDPAELSEARTLSALLSDAQKEALSGIADYTDAVGTKLGSAADELLSKFALAFRLAIILHEDSGLYAIGPETADMPVYQGTGRRLEGGGALYMECAGSFSVPKDAEDGLVFVTLLDGRVTGVFTVEEPEEGFYVIAAESDGEWLAVPAAPCADRIIRGISIGTPENGTVRAEDAAGAIFSVTRTEDGFCIGCDDPNGAYALTRTDATKQTLAVAAGDTAFRWLHFADGTDRLQADGYYGRAVLYGKLTKGFGYFAPAYFENASFLHVQMLRVTFLRGDANLDGRRTAADATLILRSVVQLSYLNAPMCAAADCNGDGEVTAADAAKILRIVVQLESEEDLN